MSSLSASCTSSTVTSTPFLPGRAMAAARADLRSVPHSRVDTPARAFTKPRSMSAHTLASGADPARRSTTALTSPLRAVSSTTSQPSSLAISPSSVSKTVFPEPRGPLIRISLPGAPGPSASPSEKSRMTFSLPASTGGSAPAVGLNGFVTRTFAMAPHLR